MSCSQQYSVELKDVLTMEEQQYRLHLAKTYDNKISLIDLLQLISLERVLSNQSMDYTEVFAAEFFYID